MEMEGCPTSSDPVQSTCLLQAVGSTLWRNLHWDTADAEIKIRSVQNPMLTNYRLHLISDVR